MFIVSKRNFNFDYFDGTERKRYHVPAEYMGTVPDFLAEMPLFKSAVKGGLILVPDTTADKALHKAEDKAAQAEAAADIRPDAKKKTRKK